MSFKEYKLYGIDLSFKCLGNCERRKKKFYGFGRLERTLNCISTKFSRFKSLQLSVGNVNGFLICF